MKACSLIIWFLEHEHFWNWVWEVNIIWKLCWVRDAQKSGATQRSQKILWLLLFVVTKKIIRFFLNPNQLKQTFFSWLKIFFEEKTHAFQQKDFFKFSCHVTFRNSGNKNVKKIVGFWCIWRDWIWSEKKFSLIWVQIKISCWVGFCWFHEIHYLTSLSFRQELLWYFQYDNPIQENKTLGKSFLYT